MTKSINPMVTLLESGTYGIVSATRSLTRAYRQLAFEIVKTKQADFQNRMELWIARTYSNSL